MADIRAQGPQGNPRELQSSAAGSLHTTDPQWEWVGDEQLTVAGSVVGLASTPAAARLTYVQVTAAPIFWSHHPSSIPASGVGSDAASGDDIYLYGSDQIAGFRAIRNGSVSAVLKVQYYREIAYDDE